MGSVQTVKENKMKMYYMMFKQWYEVGCCLQFDFPYTISGLVTEETERIRCMFCYRYDWKEYMYGGFRRKQYEQQRL